MASEVDDWPDHQIREKFDEFGISSPPVTGSTRKFLVKKLKNLMANGGATPTKQVEEEPYEEEPDVPPLPPTRIPRRLGRSALSTLNDTQNVPSSAAHSPSLSPVKRSFSPGRSPARVPLASSIQDTERSTRSKSPGRLPPASSDENILPARKVTPGRRVPERESEPIFSSQLTSPNAYTSSPSNFELFKSRKSIERNKDVGNDTFRSRLLDSSTGDYESDFMKRLSNGASYLPKRQLDDEDLMWSDDETDLRDPLQFFSKTLGYEILSSNENRRYPLAIYLAFLAPFAILVTACAAYFKIAPLAEWIVTLGVTTIVAYLFYFAVQWRLVEKQKFTENVVSAFEKFVEMMKTGKFMKTKQAADELVAAGFSVDVITAVLKKATSDLRFKLYERDGITGYFWAAKGESSDKPGKFLLTNGGVGGHFVAPSSCLKIRGMFDPSSQIMNNQEIGRIVDAVLEECTGNMLVHVAVDPRSSDGVVYARGLLGADAAGVFRKINGSIFEGRRVTVKFIRPTRYNEKFPQSVSLTRPLRPSTRSY